MSGPLDIAKFSGEAARTGAVPLVAFMAAISLQLGIFNLLPIPVLDGGHLFLLSLEGIARRDFSLRVKERILQVGFVMILALLAVVLYNDLAKNVPTGWWPFSTAAASISPSTTSAPTWGRRSAPATWTRRES